MDGGDGEDESEESIENIKLFVFHTGMKQGQFVHKQRWDRKKARVRWIKRQREN